MPFDDFLHSAFQHFTPAQVLVEASECAPYATDWTKIPGRPSAVFLPETTEKVATLLKLCSEHHIAVIPSGGRTGLTGGATATNGEVILALNRMRKLGEVDLFGRSMRVQAGITTQEVHERAAESGLLWPIDLAAKGSSTIGGNLATNAGGLRVIRYGMARKWVTALQVVTMRGDILELNRNLEKNNSGYDLLQLIIGSEGTLAVITEATLKLTPLPKDTAVFLLGVKSLEELMKLLLSARGLGKDILAFEFFSERCAAAVEKQLGKRRPLNENCPYYALLEIENFPEIERDPWISRLLDSKLISDGSVGNTSSEKSKLWAIREGITESIAKTGQVRKYDVAVPVRETAIFLREASQMAEKDFPEFNLYLFGHLGDGSPHLNLVKLDSVSQEAYEQACDRYEHWLYRTLKAMGGSSSAEHGIGLLKKKWVTFSRSEAELSLFGNIKKAFDPQGLLNPGKLIDLSLESDTGLIAHLR